jgi:DNA-binding response OmpR family regulator
MTDRTAQRRALLVEDTEEYVRVGTRLLENEGYHVSVARDGGSAVQMARADAPELMLLDISLPVLDGIEVCRRVREFSDAYVIMLTARDEEFDRVLGLAVGADDYVTKPFSARELSMRIKAMQRRPRAPGARAELRDFGDLTIDPAAREVRVHGDLVELTRIEFDLLDTLAATPRRAFGRRVLMAEVWGQDWFGDDHVVDVHLANLRKKIGEPAARSRHITTVRGIGYRFDP